MSVVKARATKKQANNDQAIAAPVSIDQVKAELENEVKADAVQKDQAPVPTGLRCPNQFTENGRQIYKQWFFYKQTNDYSIFPYDNLISIPATAWPYVSSSFAKWDDKLNDLPLTRYTASITVSYEIATAFDLSDYTFDNQSSLKAFLRYYEIPFSVKKTEQIAFTKGGVVGDKRPTRTKSSGTTGTTMGGSSDPFNRADTSIPVDKELIRSVKRGSASHLALVMGLEGVNIKNGDQTTIDRINELTANNEYEKIEPNQFSWKFRNVAIHAGYGFELIGNRTYKLVLPQGMTNIKLS